MPVVLNRDETGVQVVSDLRLTTPAVVNLQQGLSLTVTPLCV